MSFEAKGSMEEPKQGAEWSTEEPKQGAEWSMEEPKHGSRVEHIGVLMSKGWSGA